MGLTPGIVLAIQSVPDDPLDVFLYSIELLKLISFTQVFVSIQTIMMIKSPYCSPGTGSPAQLTDTMNPFREVSCFSYIICKIDQFDYVDVWKLLGPPANNKHGNIAPYIVHRKSIK